MIFIGGLQLVQFRRVKTAILIGLTFIFTPVQGQEHTSTSNKHPTISQSNPHSTGYAKTGTAEFDNQSALQYSQAAIGQALKNYQLVDRDGKPVKFTSFRGKPLIISLVYSSCFHTCPVITEHLARAVKLARSAVGNDSFAIVSIGFDTRHDKPATMKTFARKHGVSRDPAWEFLSAQDEDTMSRLTENLGFIFQRTLNGFDHLAQISVVDAQGNIYRQVYGENFNPPIMVETLKELVFGEKSSDMSITRIVNKVRLWCTVYDPNSNSYRFNYAMVLGFGISFIFLGVFAYILTRMWIKLLTADKGNVQP